jgi:hypothetical protein
LPCLTAESAVRQGIFLKKNASGLKQDVSGLKQDASVMKNDVAE